MIINDVSRVAPPLLCTLPANFNHHSSSRRNKLITHPPSNRRTRVRITVAPSKSALPPYFYRIMPPLNKRKKSISEVTKERERQRKIRKMQEERGWESSEEEEDITAVGLLQRTRTRSVDSVSASDESGNSESEDDEVLVSEEEEAEEVDESAFEKLINSSLEQSR